MVGCDHHEAFTGDCRGHEVVVETRDAVARGEEDNGKVIRVSAAAVTDWTNWQASFLEQRRYVESRVEDLLEEWSLEVGSLVGQVLHGHRGRACRRFEDGEHQCARACICRIIFLASMVGKRTRGQRDVVFSGWVGDQVRFCCAGEQ